jgi:hypothetical protein
LLAHSLVPTGQQLPEHLDRALLIGAIGHDPHPMAHLDTGRKDAYNASRIHGWPPQRDVLQPNRRSEARRGPDKGRRRPGVQARLRSDLELDRSHGSSSG